MTSPERTRFGAWLIALAVGTALASSQGAEAVGTLKLAVIDGSTGAVVPARVEILGADSAYHVAQDALRVGGDCDMSDQGAGFTDLASTLAGFSDRVENAYRQSTQFYTTGRASIALPEGSATVRVWKGPEFKVPTVTVDVPASGTIEREIRLTRWTNMPSRGWYSADDHLHIPRPSPELNSTISKMMQAEDIHVANLLQMGKVVNKDIAVQHAHGKAGYYREGNYILAAGQENPRTHFLGHTITLGAPRFTYNPEKYLIYRLIWEETVKHGAINGFAHAFAARGSPIAPHDGMALVLPHDILHFVEVLQFNRSGYETWYDLLALGARVTPTAGTDFPCADQTIPGHERFYTKVDGELTYEKWIHSVRDGRTFVTSGPMLEFKIDEAEVGGEIELDAPATVRLVGRATFDPEQDALAFLELLQNGEVVERFSRVEGRAEISFDVRRQVDASSWFAVRGYGVRLEEDQLLLWAARGTAPMPMLFANFDPTSNVHSAPIYVRIEGQPGIERSERSKRVATAWLARLDDLERMLEPSNLDHLGATLELPNFDAVPTATLRANRDDLLKEITAARSYFTDLAGP